MIRALARWRRGAGRAGASGAGDGDEDEDEDEGWDGGPGRGAGPGPPVLRRGAGRGRLRARRAPDLPGPRRGLSRRRNPEGAAGADPGPIPFSGSKASPRFWSVSRLMGNDRERPSVKVSPLSVLGTGLVLRCVFREKRETDERLEAVLFGQIVDSDTAQESNAPFQLQKEN